MVEMLTMPLKPDMVIRMREEKGKRVERTVH
jgi:hypothetical protein